MAETTITLEFLAARVGFLEGAVNRAVTDQMHDPELRFAALEARLGTIDTRISTLTTVVDTRFAAVDAHFAAIDRRLAILEERQNRILAILVRLAERQGLPPQE
jgi:hypothetical protein